MSNRYPGYSVRGVLTADGSTGIFKINGPVAVFVACDNGTFQWQWDANNGVGTPDWKNFVSSSLTVEGADSVTGASDARIDFPETATGSLMVRGVLTGSTSPDCKWRVVGHIVSHVAA